MDVLQRASGDMDLGTGGGVFMLRAVVLNRGGNRLYI